MTALTAYTLLNLKLINDQWLHFKINKKTIKLLTITIIILTPFITFFFNERINIKSISRRSNLNIVGLKIFLQHPILGIGINNFTSEVTTNFEIIRNEIFLQPAHNVIILLLAETGIIGIYLYYLGYSKLKTHIDFQQLIFLLPIILFDHYLLTNQTGLIAISLALIFSSLNIN